MKEHITVAAGVIVRKDGKILLAQRRKGSHKELLWEFPGGKLEKNETIEECLVREIDEELGLNIVVKDLIKQLPFEYETKIVDLHIFFATCSKPETMKMNAHEKIEWIFPKDLNKFELVPADELAIPSIEAIYPTIKQGLV